MFVILSDRNRAASDSRQNVCLQCHHYTSLRYALTDSEERICTLIEMHPRHLRGPVSRCTDFVDKTKPKKWEMDKMAWVIEVSKREVGFNGPQSVRFVPPSERKDIDQ